MTRKELHDLARQVLTPAQFEAWELHDRRMSERSIALALRLSRSAVRDRLDAAERRLATARRQGDAA